MGKDRRRKSLGWVLLLLLLLGGWSPAQAAPPGAVVIVAEGEYVMGTGETMEVARERAKKAALQAAAEKAGAFVRSYTKVNNLTVETDVIEVVASHAMKVEILERKETEIRAPQGGLDAVRFYVRVRATLTEAEIEANLKKVKADRGIADAYHRLQEEYERQAKQLAKIKSQLEQALPGEKSRLAQMISAEEKKYKATLWVEKAEISSVEEALAAYRKAWELNPELTLAYIGAARVLRDSYSGDSDNRQFLQDKLSALTQAQEHLTRALVIDDDAAIAYARRAEVILMRMETEERLLILQQGGTTGEFDNIKKEYAEKILADLNRAIVLDAPGKAGLYLMRSLIYHQRAFSGEEEENNYLQALTDLKDAIVIEKETHNLIDYYRRKANVYRDLSRYYESQARADQAREALRLSNELFAQANELVKQQQARQREEEEAWEREQKAFAATEVGRLNRELDVGWKERVAGFQFQELEKMDEEVKKKKWDQLTVRLREKVATNVAQAFEYLVLYEHSDEERDRDLYLTRGVALLEKQNPEGKDALILVRFYLDLEKRRRTPRQMPQALALLDKARAVTERHLGKTQAFLPLNEALSFFQELEKTRNLVAAVRRVAPTPEKAEALFWVHMAKTIIRERAALLETLGLLSRALGEYRVLCETYQQESACRDAARLR